MTGFRGLGAYDDGTAEAPGAGTTPLDVRRDLAGLLAPSGGFIGGLTGVLATHRTVLVQGTSGWGYQILGHHVVSSKGEADGVQLWGNDGAVTVSTDLSGTQMPQAAPANGLQRIDIIWELHPTNTENGDTSSAPVFGVSWGTPNAIPQPPSIPTGAVELARNTMSAGATSTNSSNNAITQTFRRTALRGTAIPVRDATERAVVLGVVGASAVSPLLVWRIDTKVYELTTDGTTWRRLATSSGGYMSFTPAWTADAGSQPSFGNGSIAGRFKIVDGDTGVFTIRMAIGNAGASGGGPGLYRFSLPFTPGGIDTVVAGEIIQGNARVPIAGVVSPGAAYIHSIASGAGANFSSGYALAAGAIVILSGRCEVA